MRKFLILFSAWLVLSSFGDKQGSDVSNIKTNALSQLVNDMTNTNSIEDNTLLAKGVKHAANLWRESDGTEAEFEAFCKENYIADPVERELVFNKISRNIEIITGHFNKITLDLLEPVHLNTFEQHTIDNQFGAYSVGAHWQDDFYKNKIAFIIALNFPPFSLEEKEKLAGEWTRQEWAYARLGDYFTARVPAELLQNANKAAAGSDVYIMDYNIYVGHLTDEAGKRFFPEDKVLLSHWNLRDEIKANYANSKDGLEKQKIIYQVMQRIISQEIPEKVINSGDFEWDPYANVVYKNGKTIEATPEPNERYQQILNNFHANKAIDPYYPGESTFIERQYAGAKEISHENTEKIFTDFLRSEETKQVGELIKKRLGRDLEPFDIWYDGFKARSGMDESKLDAQTRKLYPNAAALEADLSNLLVKLGYDKARAKFLADHIAVDPARGSGHAWGGAKKGQKAHLRTRISEKGMDYKGYNIAIHEFGHNVEQTISLYDVDNFTMNGVPNTAFTEALAFIFQKRDMVLLERNVESAEKDALKKLDLFWSAYEIMGVSVLDIRVWKWLYANPEANAAQLRDATMQIAKEVWNEFYAPVYGMKDQTILAVYSHMLNSPLYLSNYAFGNVIEFQLEEQLKGKSFPNEVDRIFKQGRLTPNQWMVEATGNDLSAQPLLKAAKEALEEIK
ncbi:hypothetical protein L3049_00625 [Labilibaculum sp. DW002]|uniref:Peptidase M3A/M3B catalytic domain-containing protein n=1 Tax=Paralabilibaculum antarcticum TaxID=2912572 RepID=A0ABT5VML3_9BACT|nr:hypothetical protein [Labilibaculum sp. DW002]MDE5416491.1 hypothetical protein [Labilibaculum sp. DW002]